MGGYLVQWCDKECTDWAVVGGYLVQWCDKEMSSG